MSDPGAHPRRRRDAAVRVALVLMAVAGTGLVARTGQVLATGRHLPPQYSVPASPPPPAAVPVTSSVPSASPTPHPRTETIDTAVSDFVPASLQIPGLHLTAPVIGVTADAGTLNPPEQPQIVGWWLGSALARADTGTTVVVGHIDSATRGLGALFHLDQVKAGDTVQLASSHATMTYQVTSLHYYVKTAGLPGSLFTRSGPPRLVVISCGGSFDRATRSYRQNIVVVADPVTR